MTKSRRRIVASLIIMVFLVLWIWAAGTIGTWLADGPGWASLIFFVIAGIGWALPLRPVLRWMNSGPDA